MAVKQDMAGWYFTSTGNWRAHPTIQRIKAMNDLIREVEKASIPTPFDSQAATETHPDASNRSDRRRSRRPHDARRGTQPDGVARPGQRDNVKRMMLKFFENSDDMALAGR